MNFAAASLRIFSGVIVWALHFAAIYGFTGLACARGLATAVPWGIVAATLLAATACLVIMGREIRRRRDFESWLTMGIAAFALLAIAWETLPILMIRPCV